MSKWIKCSDEFPDEKDGLFWIRYHDDVFRNQVTLCHMVNCTSIVSVDLGKEFCPRDFDVWMRLTYPRPPNE